MRIKIFIILLFTLYQTSSFAKTNDKNDFNYKYLSNYFSALLSFDNQKNEKALEFFETSKSLKRKHEKFSKFEHFKFEDFKFEKKFFELRVSKNFFSKKSLLKSSTLYKKSWIILHWLAT